MGLLKNITHFPERSDDCPSDNEPLVRSVVPHCFSSTLLPPAGCQAIGGHSSILTKNDP